MKTGPPPPELRPTSDYSSMVDLGRRSGLETSSIVGALAAFGFFIGDEMVGCAYLKEKSGIFIVECLAVDQRVRGQGLGSALVRKVEDEARSRGAIRIWALARQPAFFVKNGYTSTSGNEPDGPNLKECAGCNQYLKECNPAVMVKVL